MYSNILRGGSKYLQRLAKKSGIKASARVVSEEVDDFAEDWLDIGSLNKGEDERLKERDEQVSSIKKNVEDWNDNDLSKAMNSREYQYNKSVQEKVQKYFEKRYPGKQRLDATGRPI